MHVCMYVCILYLLFGSCCQDVSSFGRRAKYMHTFYFIFYLVVAAKMCHISVAPAKMFHLLVEEPYTSIYTLYFWFLLPRCVIFRYTCQDVSSFGRGAIYIHTFFSPCCQDVSSFGSTCQDVTSFGRRTICMHILSSFGFCMAAVAVIISCRCGHNTNVHHRN